MARIPGPNVVHACTASNRMADAGPHMKWCECEGNVLFLGWEEREFEDGLYWI